MIISFEGIQGMGKTTAAVAIAYEEHLATGKKVISNTHLNFDYQHFDLAWFLEHLVDHEMEDCLLVLDEMYQLADSRSSATKLNKLVTYFVVQARKRNVDWYVCTHHIDHIDLRLRRAIDIRGSCRGHEERPCKACRCRACGGVGSIMGGACEVCGGVGGTGQVGGQPCERCLGYGKIGWFRVNFLDRRMRKRYPSDVLPYFNGPILGNKYWHLFNTRERIPMQARILQGIETLEVI